MTAMPVDPQILQVIDAFAALKLRLVHEQTPAEARARYVRMMEACAIAPSPARGSTSTSP